MVVDISVLEKVTKDKSTKFHGIKLLIEKFVEAHPQVLNIVTTNYDRVLEYIMSFQGIPFTEGIPLVLITKKISDSTFEELKDAEKYLLFEELDNS